MPGGSAQASAKGWGLNGSLGANREAGMGSKVQETVNNAIELHYARRAPAVFQTSACQPGDQRAMAQAAYTARPVNP
jgi:hypothetical protein